MRKALVTGAGGFIGYNLVRVLLSKKYKVFALVEKNDDTSITRLKKLSLDIDILDNFDTLINSASTMDSFDVIFHLATVGVRPDYTDIELICDINIKMGCKMVDFVANNKSKLLVNFGSCFEYGDHGGALLSEDMNCYPESLYAISKNAATNLITCYSKIKNINMITVRPFGVYGEGEGESRLAPSIIKSCLAGEEIKTTGGKQVRDFVNVKDVVKAIVELCESEKYDSFEIYNICSDNPISVKAFVKEIVEVCGFDINMIKFGALPYRNNEAMVFSGNNKKLQNIINYPFPDNHKEGILDIFNLFHINK